MISRILKTLYFQESEADIDSENERVKKIEGNLKLLLT